MAWKALEFVVIVGHEWWHAGMHAARAAAVTRLLIDDGQIEIIRHLGSGHGRTKVNEETAAVSWLGFVELDFAAPTLGERSYDHAQFGSRGRLLSGAKQLGVMFGRQLGAEVQLYGSIPHQES